ncbi:cytochrome P450 monooxygenase CYP52X1 [Lactarius tabidus]
MPALHKRIRGSVLSTHSHQYDPAKTVVAQLDRVKMLFQASNPVYQKYAGTWSGAFHAGAQIYKDSGTLELFQGHSISMLTRAQETNLRLFSVRAISALFTYPLELLCVRIAFRSASRCPERPSSLITARFIYSEGGAPTTPIKHDISTPSRSSNSTAASLSASSASCHALRRDRVSHLGLPARCHARPQFGFAGWASRAYLGIGVLAGAAARAVSYPFEVVRRRIRIGGLTQPGCWLCWGETVRGIWARGGPQGFPLG